MKGCKLLSSYSRSIFSQNTGLPVFRTMPAKMGHCVLLLWQCPAYTLFLVVGHGGGWIILEKYV